LAVTKQTLQLGRVVTAAHYSPSGVTPTPSPDDARLTLRLCAAADVLDLPLLDHLIVGDDGLRSEGVRPRVTEVGWTPVRFVTASRRCLP
jgi:DNA repair protein RadC